MIHLRNGSIAVDALNHAVDFPLSDYEAMALEFCRSWVNGKDIFYLQSSGSTGKPKTIEVKRSQMAASAAMTAKALGLKAGEVALSCLNVKYIAGQMMLVRALELKMDVIVVEPSSHPFSLLPDMRISIDFMALVPLQLESLLSDPDSFPLLNGIRHILVGGAPVSLALHQSLQVLEGNVYSTFGMTETVSHIALRKLNGKDQSEHYHLLEGVLAEEDDRGCLTVRSEVTQGKIVVSNDLVEFVEGNAFQWLGRMDHVINSGGVKVHPEQLERMVERIFFQLGLERNFFVCGLPDERLGEVVCLVVEGSSLGTDQESKLYDHFRKDFEGYVRPRGIFYVSHFLMVNNKLDRLGSRALLIQ